MKKPKITQGKLEPFYSHAGEFYTVKHIETGQMPIYCFTNEHIKTGIEQAKANCELICEAFNLTNDGFNISSLPELVEALEESLKALRAWNLIGVPKECAKMHSNMYEASPEIRKIKQALKKAKFEE